jgi:maleamate amidohydrolase
METTTKTAKEIFLEVQSNPARKKFGFGKKAILVNIDPQKAYTRTDLYPTAYETDPEQLNYVNQLADQMREKGWPVVWTHVAYMESGEDCGVWGTRTDTENSLQNIKFGSERSELDDRLQVDAVKDVVILKKMPSAFHDTLLTSLLTYHKVDTVLITGGSTSGCVRATAVDALSRGFRACVIEECVADRHESFHFANLTDLQLKYADVESVESVKKWLKG